MLTFVYSRISVLRHLCMAMLLSVPCLSYAYPPTSSLFNPVLYQAHVWVAIVTSSVFLAAFALAVVMWFQSRRLHMLSERSKSWLDYLPPVLTMEKALFTTVWIGFVLLTVLMVTGMFFSEEVTGRAFVLTHKTIFTIMAWFVFAGLLLGRYVRGWRGLIAIRATIFGFVLLFLAYVGTHFVLDVILRRH